MYDPTRLMVLPTGTRVAHSAIRVVQARALRTPFCDDDGTISLAQVLIETRSNNLLVPCATLADAERLRDEIADEVDRRNADAAARRMPQGARNETTRPAAGSAQAESPGARKETSRPMEAAL